jgi:hypothetical protein
MRVREAKDFLVQQTAEQAQLEGVALSELEKRMMYFTESGYVPEDPIALNEEFEDTLLRLVATSSAVRVRLLGGG